MTSHEEVARLFAHRQKGKGFNVYTDGKTIYSYGDHWPIAVWIGGICYLNTSKTSVSTSKHTTYVERAVASNFSYNKIVEVSLEEIKSLNIHTDDDGYVVLNRLKLPETQEQLKEAIKHCCYAHKISPQRTAHFVKKIMAEFKRVSILSQI